MSDLLEDPDGAPYPEEVQELVRVLEVEFLGEVELAEAKRMLVEALESVAADVWDAAFETGGEFVSAWSHGDNGPSDPPRNPHERST